MNNIAIIVASGTGNRTGLDMPKQFIKLGEQTILKHAFDSFVNSEIITHIIIVANDEFFSLIDDILGEAQNYTITKGGKTRAESVFNGLVAASKLSPDNVYIHDAARPFIPKEIILNLDKMLFDGADGALPTLLIADALWESNNGNLIAPIDKSTKLRAQTPQAFKFGKLYDAFSKTDFKTALDDAQIAVQNGMIVKAIKGSYLTDKITFREDFERMEKLIPEKTNYSPNYIPRIGSGFDAHKFGDGDFITLCGIEIPHDMGLLGHSDADVAWHALTDAILGAMALGDIGKAFPPSEAKWKGAASSIFLEYARDECIRLNGQIINIDLTIICEAPKLGPYREQLQKKTAEILQIPIDRIGIKATTTEKMGFTGRKEGIAAQAVVSILQRIA